jgi:hypothetical protein
LVAVRDLELDTRSVRAWLKDEAKAFGVKRTATKAMTVESDFHGGTLD